MVRRRLAGLACLVLVAGGCAWTPEDVVPQIPQNAQSSKVYAADGSLLYTAHGDQNRVEVPLARIPLALQRAVIAIEDERFYDHSGVDLQAVLRAAQENAEQGTVTQGGSTITQQLVKITLLNSGRTVDRKVQEASLAWQLEQTYSKDQILEIYLNTIYFGNGAYGVEAATQTYFGHRIDDVVPAEAALLAGLVHAPNADDPVAHPDQALARRAVVLDKMLELGFLGQIDHDAAVATPLAIASTPLQDRYPAAHFVEEVKQQILNDPVFGETNEQRQDLLFNGGLRINTTLDVQAQAAAEKAVADVLPDPATYPDAALVAIDPRSGYVRALVGGSDYFGEKSYAKYDLAVGKGRGTGSSFKPIVLAAALTQGIPLSEVLSAPPCISLTYAGATEPWTPCNADPGEGAPGGANLVEGTVHSFNTLYAQLVLKVGPDNAVEMAKKLGITTPLKPVPSVVLGSEDVRPIEMASVYGTLANRGVHVDPVMITKVSDARGNVIYEAPRTSQKAIDASVADQVTSVLQQVIERGTGTAAKLTRPAAGKTGTGEDFKNAWFCGYTRQLATAVWVGFGQDERTQMQPPNTSITVYGGTWPAEIWQRFMTAALSGVPPSDFVAPSGPKALPPESTTTTAPALGPPTDVPSVVGLDATAAADLLGRHALRAFTVQVDDPSKAGTVTRQSPAAGTQAPENSTVTIQVARGAPGTSAPAGSAVVPSVVGRSRADAGAALNASGFAVVASDVPESDVVPSSRRGLVWRQTPPGGQTAPVGSLVAIDANP